MRQSVPIAVDTCSKQTFFLTYVSSDRCPISLILKNHEAWKTTKFSARINSGNT